MFLGRKHLDGVEPSASVRFLGEYDRSELPARLEALTPDAVLLLSRWPETFLYTLTEAWRNGLPVFATDVGALGERVRATGAGVLFAPDDVAAAAATIAEALRDPARMASIRAAAVEAGMAEPSVAEMAAEYLGTYRRLVSDRRRTPTAIPPAPDQGEMDGWFGSFAVPFPSAEASPLRQ